MFYYISKVFWFFAQPSSLVIIFLVAGTILYLRGRVKTGMRIIVLCVVFIAVTGLSPLSFLLMLSLEQQYSKPPIDGFSSPDGVIVLGGMIDTTISEGRGEMALNHGAERLTEAARLAYRFPDARILISGGVGTF